MSRTLTIIILFVVCAIAAATGGYIAVKQSGAAAIAPAVVSTAPAAAQASAGSTQAQAPAVQPAAGNPAVATAEPSATPSNSAAAQIDAAASARNSATSKPAASAVKSSHAPARSAPPVTNPSQLARSASNVPVAGRPGGTVSTGVPVSPDPQAPPPAGSQVSAPVELAQAPAPPPPPVPMFEEVVVPAESVLGLQVLTTTSTEEARVEDAVEAKVTRDLRIGRTVAIPAGTRVLGNVTLVERGGKVKGKARLGVRFHTLVLADAAATRVPIRTDTIFRESESQGQQSAAKIGAAAAGGAILGAIIGGGKGAVIGGAIGAGSGTASVMRGDRSQATLQAGTALTVRLQDAVTVTIEK